MTRDACQDASCRFPQGKSRGMCGKMLTRHCVRSQGYEILAVGDGTFSKLMLDHSMFRTVQVRERGGWGLGGGIQTYCTHTEVAPLHSGEELCTRDMHGIYSTQYTVHGMRTLYIARAHTTGCGLAKRRHRRGGLSEGRWCSSLGSSRCLLTRIECIRNAPGVSAEAATRKERA